MSQHCWIRYVRKPGEATAAASEIHVCQLPPSEANWGKGGRQSQRVSCSFTPPTLICLSLQGRSMPLRKYCIPLEEKTKQKRSFQSYVRACTDFTSSIYVSEKLPVSRGEANIIPFFWLAVSRVHVPTCTFHTRTHFFISLLNGFPQRLKMNPIWLWAARRLLNLIQWHDRASPSDSKQWWNMWSTLRSKTVFNFRLWVK